MYEILWMCDVSQRQAAQGIQMKASILYWLHLLKLHLQRIRFILWATHKLKKGFANWHVDCEKLYGTKYQILYTVFIIEAGVLIWTVYKHTLYYKTQAPFFLLVYGTQYKVGTCSTRTCFEKKKLIRVDNDIENYSRNCHHLFFV